MTIEYKTRLTIQVSLIKISSLIKTYIIRKRYTDSTQRYKLHKKAFKITYLCGVGRMNRSCVIVAQSRPNTGDTSNHIPKSRLSAIDCMHIRYFSSFIYLVFKPCLKLVFEIIMQRTLLFVIRQCIRTGC